MKPAVETGDGPLPSSPKSDLPLPIVSASTQPVKSAEIFGDRIQSFEGHGRAFLKVQDGCDANCSYCIIPRLRTRLRSKPIDVAVAEAAALVRQEYREIVVTGIFLGAYGRPTAVRRRFHRGPSPLSRLVHALAGVEGLLRLRLSSLEPGDVDDSLLEIMATNPVCVPHLHLPLQSGSERILRLMNRQYRIDSFLRMVERVRTVWDRPAISTDIIVGFPGESDADFEESIRIAEWAEFCQIHAFPFSPREGTPAFRRCSDFVHSWTVHERMRRLTEIARISSERYRRRLLGLTERVIVERDRNNEAGSSNSRRWRHGRIDRYVDVHFESMQTLRPGDVAKVRIDHVTAMRTFATQMLGDGRSYSLFVLPHEAA